MKRHTSPKKATRSLAKCKEVVWDLCRQITRLRYRNEDGTWYCYTCGRLIDEPVKAQTGHCIPSSVGGVLCRFDLRNLRIQDYYCNINLGGNGAIFIEKLRAEIGNEEVDDLLAQRHKTVKADVLYFERKIEELVHTLELEKQLHFG